MNLKQILELCWGDPCNIWDSLDLGIWVFKNEETGLYKFESFENILNQVMTSNRNYN